MERIKSPNISYHTGLVKSMCKITKNLRRNFKVVEITKDTADYIRNKDPKICIVRTMSGHTSKRGKYYVEDSKAVLKLLSEYNESEKIIYEYPVSK